MYLFHELIDERVSEKLYLSINIGRANFISEPVWLSSRFINHSDLLELIKKLQNMSYDINKLVILGYFIVWSINSYEVS